MPTLSAEQAAPPLLPGLALCDARIALARAFTAAGIDSAHTDARMLLQHITGLSHAALIACERERRLTAEEAARLRTLVARRLRGEPVSRIIGTRAFFGRDFLISPDVLDPRPETELLVEAALKLRAHVESLHSGPPRLCDAGTGSGCIIISVLAQWPTARALALDISAAALRLARRNAARHGVASRLLCVRANWIDAVAGPLDMLIANPPYISEQDMKKLPPEVRHDPPLALAAGKDGLAAYRALARRAACVLRPGGWLLLEVGKGQMQAVRALFEQTGFAAGEALPPVQRDLAGIERVLALRKLQDRHAR